VTFCFEQGMLMRGGQHAQTLLREKKLMTSTSFYSKIDQIWQGLVLVDILF
jgi:hypothetical protein